jgi:hypothetical protein
MSVCRAVWGVSHRVQLGLYLRAHSGECCRMCCEMNWMRTVMQAGSVSSNDIGRLIASFHLSVLENIRGGVLWSILKVYLGASCERKPNRLAV